MQGSPADRFAAILELYDFAVRQMRSNLQRRHPQADAAEIDKRLSDWLLHRPGAEHGDASGRVVSVTLRR